MFEFFFYLCPGFVVKFYSKVFNYMRGQLLLPTIRSFFPMNFFNSDAFSSIPHTKPHLPHSPTSCQYIYILLVEPLQHTTVLWGPVTCSLCSPTRAEGSLLHCAAVALASISRLSILFGISLPIHLLTGLIKLYYYSSVVLLISK